ncbi:tetratricopeptide repeat protein [Plantactinospora sp. S1510]|uniref:Tetratricopeptide repeat protein n=1 Tax=Plantactinospora alkalitolerans TaxID=2789879 RepID=A0ABS0GVZ7_9ACTN|nr:BTAD domain-containing putative transcriptional regulator [Plantactinospora alkalitolerans]MBF9130246.1 tetratricopeptide repeat protein [Plantactinospora alkalitolerans]
MDFADALRRQRHIANLSQQELSNIAGLNLATIRDLEQRRTRQPHPRSLRALIEALRLTGQQAAIFQECARSTPKITPDSRSVEPESVTVPEAPIRIEVLGPLVIKRGAAPVRLQSAGARTVVGRLALSPDRTVPRAQLIDLLWGDDPPPAAVRLLQAYVTRARRALEPLRPPREQSQILMLMPGGYKLTGTPSQFDVGQFRQLVKDSAKSADPAQALALIETALELWRDDPLSDIPCLRGHPLVSQLNDEKITAALLLAEICAAQNSHQRALPWLRALSAGNTLHEPVHLRLIAALAGSGHQAEALATYEKIRSRLADDLGIDPGPELIELHQRVLRQEVARPQTAGVPPVPPFVQGTGPGLNFTSSPPQELPAVSSCFIGRSATLAELDRILPSSFVAGSAVSIVAIVGTAGVGKTALATHWGRRVVDHFPDGQLYVDLHGYSAKPSMQPVEVLGAFLRSLGVRPDAMPADTDRAAAMYRSLLAGRRMLILLDNARSAEQLRPLIPGSTGCLVLVTSRDRLTGLVAREGAHRVSLDVLTPYESRRLLSHVLNEERVLAELDVADQLASICAHLPLALRIAAAHLADRRCRTIADYVDLLQGSDRIATLGVADDAGSAVRIAFDLSYAAIPRESQRLFRLLGLIPGQTFTTDAAAALYGTTQAHAVHMLDQLAAAHLVEESAPSRYTFHDLLRHYARERSTSLAEPGDTEALDNLFNWYVHGVVLAAQILYPQLLRLAEPTGTSITPSLVLRSRSEALAWLDDEWSNLRSIIQFAADHGRSAIVWLLADGLRGYLWQRADLTSWLKVSQLGLAAAKDSENPVATAAMHTSLGQVSYVLGHFRAAIEHTTQAMKISSRTAWSARHLGAITNLGIIYADFGQTEVATRLHLLVAKHWQRQGRTLDQSTSLINLGIGYRFMGRLEESVEALTRALSLIDESAQTGVAWAVALESLGNTYHDLGQRQRALTLLSESLTISHDRGNLRQELNALIGIATIHLAAGDLETASELATEIETLFLHLKGSCNDGEFFILMGAISAAGDDEKQAIRCYERALSFRPAMRAHPRIVAKLGLATSFGRLGHSAVANRHASEALALADRYRYAILKGLALTALAEAHLSDGQHGEARAYATRARNSHRRTGHLPGEERALSLLARASAGLSQGRDMPVSGRSKES